MANRRGFASAGHLRNAIVEGTILHGTVFGLTTISELPAIESEAGTPAGLQVSF